MSKRTLSAFLSFFLSTCSAAQNPETITPIVPPASYPTAIDLQSTSDTLIDEVNENRESINMHQNVIHSYYPDLRRISYADGVLTLKPSWPEGTYPYTYNGKNYTTTARNLSIPLIDTSAISQNTANIETNADAISKNTSNINSNFAALDNISYNNNGTLTFGSAGSDPGTSRTKTIQLFDPTSTSQSVGALNQEMLYNHSMIQILDQRTTAENQQIQNLQWQYHDLSRTVDKQSKAISVNAAFAALPSGYMPDKNFIGIGVGHFNNRTGVALGLTRSFNNGIIVQGRYGASGGTSVVSAAAGISF